MLYNTKPKVFPPTIKVVGCFVDWNGKILILKRSHLRPQSLKWGIPGGKLMEMKVREMQ